MQFGLERSGLVSVPESLAPEHQDAIRTVAEAQAAAVPTPASTRHDDLIGNATSAMATCAATDALNQRTDTAPLLNSARRIGYESSGADI